MSNKIAIIGAGISGLTLATKLQEKGVDVQVFDKGRGVGGRMSSRRTDWGYIDHGTQYFSLSNPQFEEFISIYGDVMQPWQGKFASWKQGNFQEDMSSKIRYVPHEAMNRLCKYLSNDTTVKLKTRIVSLSKNQNSWTLIDEKNHSYGDYDTVVITAPPSQTADLLPDDCVFKQEISHIEMLPCFSLMLIPQEKVNLPFEGVQFDHPILGWVSSNDTKPSRGDGGAIVIQSNFTYATEHLEDDRDKISQDLLTQTQAVFDLKFSSFHYQSLHLWRYALPKKSRQQGYYYDEDMGLGVCGDWCLSGKVEGAFLSASAIALKIK
ncbi:NAD(P)-binding protein [Cyanobacterium stanieri LEGE 03274]|uniref:NAD(P)-binding protein n=1 Tax=Cyanobacterium stanieri LEGE 03274 TaxID=1828756 RepID=A0ABR9V1Q2_9CHRO|nr:FAD-dependent oxidoreductase [Cyanobacterium stanieri]MBE9221782.1 NAD(P)-binding protein [Cyanobacterium stanieri LEGE 03274]